MQNDTSKFKIDFYKRLVRFAVEVVAFTQTLKSNVALRPIYNQLIRSSSSVGANVTEAKSSSSKKEYIKYFEIALKSANETLFWFDVIIEIKPSEECARLRDECSQLAAIIAASVLKMKDKR